MIVQNLYMARISYRVSTAAAQRTMSTAFAQPHALSMAIHTRLVKKHGEKCRLDLSVIK